MLELCRKYYEFIRHANPDVFVLIKKFERSTSPKLANQISFEPLELISQLSKMNGSLTDLCSPQ